MKNNVQQFRGDSQGFTLVELAIVMIIIGILIGGILKGQELIANSRVTSTIAQLEAIGAAKNDFQNQFNALPGDMNNATTRLTNCTGACANGNGGGTIGVVLGVAVAISEGTAFYGQLSSAGYISGMDNTNTIAFGRAIPVAPIGGGFYVGQSITGLDSTGFLNVAPGIRPGIYVTLIADTNVVGAQGPVTGVQAFRIDTKLDDGVGTTGSLIGSSVATCQSAAGVYANAANSACSLAYRI